MSDYWKYKKFFGWNLFRLMGVPGRIKKRFSSSGKFENSIRKILECKEEEWTVVKAREIMEELKMLRSKGKK